MKSFIISNIIFISSTSIYVIIYLLIYIVFPCSQIDSLWNKPEEWTKTHRVFVTTAAPFYKCKFCHVCKRDSPSLEARQVGTEAVVTSTCSNPKCSNPLNTWHSQPVMPGSGIPAGKFLLCMAILLAGGSASKVFQIFSHKSLACVSMNTYFKYQRVSPVFYCKQLLLWELAGTQRQTRI